MSDEDRFADDVAANALGALEPAEAKALARHLMSCAVCGDELRAFEGAVERLTDHVRSYRAPRGLRRRVLAQVYPDQGRSAAAPRRPVRRGVLRGTVLVAAIAVTAVIAVRLVGAGSIPARVYPASVSQARVRASLRVADGHAELIVGNLAPPAAGEVYEVWLERSHGPPRPTTALFGVTARGAGDVAVPGELRGIVGVIVTQEPAGGSATPTLPVIISVRLA